MSIKVTMAVQLMALFVQVVFPTLELGQKANNIAHAVLGFLQGAQAIMAHYYNTDGSSQKVAFEKKAKR